MKTNLVAESTVVQSPDEDLGAQLGSDSCTIQQSCNVQEVQKLPGDLEEAQKLALPTVSLQIMSSEGVRIEPDAEHESRPDDIKQQDQVSMHGSRRENLHLLSYGSKPSRTKWSLRAMDHQSLCSRIF